MSTWLNHETTVTVGTCQDASRHVMINTVAWLAHLQLHHHVCPARQRCCLQMAINRSAFWSQLEMPLSHYIRLQSFQNHACYLRGRPYRKLERFMSNLTNFSKFAYVSSCYPRCRSPEVLASDWYKSCTFLL